MKNQNVLEVAHKIKELHYPDAAVAFAAGSVFRGEGNEFSDIDIVVLYDEPFEDVRRESIIVEGWPVEAFIQNVQAQEYFFDKNYKDGVPVMLNLVIEGVEIPGPCALSQQQKAEALRIYHQGPAPLDDKDMRARRYHLSDAIDDLRGCVKPHEGCAILSKLYMNLADFHLRAAGNWSGNSGKGLARAMRRYAPEMADRYFDAFEAAFKHDQMDKVISLAEDILQPYGGILFHYKQEADPNEWRNFKKAEP